MRIISSWTDYYDGAMRGQCDPKIVWVRDTKILEWEKGKPRSFFHNSLDWELLLVGFCGKILPCVRMEDQRDVKYKMPDTLLWSLEEFDVLCDQYHLRKDSYYRYGSSWSNRPKVNEFFVQDFSPYGKLFQEHKTPTWLLRDYKADQGIPECKQVLEINPVLKNLGFVRNYDVWTCFQELTMYVGGVLGCNEDKIPPVTDEIRLEGHGFDKNISFRKEKSDVPKRRKHRKEQ